MLTKVQLDVCRQLGLKPAEFERRQGSGAAMTGRPVSSAARGGLDEAGRIVCRELGLRETEFVAMRRRDFEREILKRGPSGGATVAASARPGIRAGGGGFVGKDVVDETLASLPSSLKDESAAPDDLAMLAAKSMKEYQSNPEADDAWQALARAAALIVLVLDRVAPVYADRHPDATISSPAGDGLPRIRSDGSTPFGDGRRTQATARSGRTFTAFGRMYAPSREA